jgi:LPS O-antigen subunit length determinant protein (WzzB/FepE family)
MFPHFDKIHKPRINEIKTREEKININMEGYNSQTNLEMNQDLNISDEDFSLP